MIISQAYKLYNTPFKGTQNGIDTNNMQEKDCKIDYFVNKSREVLFERAEKEVPVNGKFSQISVSFKIPETQNKAKIIISHDEADPKNLRRLAVGVHHENSDRLISNYVFKGTKKEMLDYLKNGNLQGKLTELIYTLSNSVDKYYSEQ